MIWQVSLAGPWFDHCPSEHSSRCRPAEGLPPSCRPRMAATTRMASMVDAASADALAAGGKCRRVIGACISRRPWSIGSLARHRLALPAGGPGFISDHCTAAIRFRCSIGLSESFSKSRWNRPSSEGSRSCPRARNHSRPEIVPLRLMTVAAGRAGQPGRQVRLGQHLQQGPSAPGAQAPAWASRNTA